MFINTNNTKVINKAELGLANINDNRLNSVKFSIIIFCFIRNILNWFQFLL